MGKVRRKKKGMGVAKVIIARAPQLKFFRLWGKREQDWRGKKTRARTQTKTKPTTMGGWDYLKSKIVTNTKTQGLDNGKEGNGAGQKNKRVGTRTS